MRIYWNSDLLNLWLMSFTIWVLVLYNKLYQMLSQFNQNPDYPEQCTLPQELESMGVNPIGRLDYDSEGGLLLSDDQGMERSVMHPDNKKPKTYLVQVEGTPSDSALELLRKGGLVIRVSKKEHVCAPAEVSRLGACPEWVWARSSPVAATAKTAWIELTLTEGKNRQVRRMTAKLGHPTLRLIRTHVAGYDLAGLAAGEWVIVG